MRLLYDVLWHALLPWLPVRLWWRGRKEAGYREHVAERFGRYDARVSGPVLWVHAVSLGETHAARPLIERLRSAHPEVTVLLTHMTATGRAAGAQSAGPGLLQSWLPYDLPWAVEAFLRHFQPAVGILLETELWPNLVTRAAARGIPMYLLNARLSARSARRYARVPRFTHAVLSRLAGVAAQTPDDAARLAALGAPPPAITGNLKFDVAIPPDAAAKGAALRQRFGDRPTCLVASTRDGEEALLLDALARTPLPAGTLLAIVPRHPQRFDAVAKLLAERGVRFERRSSDVPVPSEAAVVLGDSMGEMAAYCAAADVVIMGGSLLPLGGQNLIEPLALGKPTIVGVHMFNFAQATADALAAGAALQVDGAGEALAAAGALLLDTPRRARMSEAALAFHAAHRGAGDRLWDWLAPRLDTALARASR